MLDSIKHKAWWKKWKKDQKWRIPTNIDQYDNWKQKEITLLKAQIIEFETHFKFLLTKKDNKYLSIIERTEINYIIFLLKEKINLLNQELKKISMLNIIDYIKGIQETKKIKL